MTTSTQGEHAQTEALAHELFAAAQLAPGEGIEDAVSRIAAALTAPPAQPAAPPQGAAYAELPAHDSDSICAWSVWWTHNKSKFTTPRQASNAAWAAARASNGQAPAGAAVVDQNPQNVSDKEACVTPVIDKTAPTAQAADSVLEDAAQLAKITQAIRDYHFALDNREHGGVAMARAWNAICDVLNMDWVQGAESAARKQGGA